jgi:membrane protein CcdC involved in cytochrome C biogenesis
MSKGRDIDSNSYSDVIWLLALVMVVRYRVATVHRSQTRLHLS